MKGSHPIDYELKLINKKKKVKNGRFRSKISSHNVESAGFASGSVKGQYDVSAQARKKAAANTNDKQSPLAAG